MICILENDPDIRYILGEKGKNNLIVICLNPSTATCLKHDGTTDNIKKIANVNGYDGWILFNLSPQRTPYPYLLDEKPHEGYLNENRKSLRSHLFDTSWNLKNVWLAWGNNISIRNYLREQALMVLEDLQKHQLSYWHIKETLKGHPFHPSKRSINSFIGPVGKIKLKPFDYEDYILKISE